MKEAKTYIVVTNKKERTTIITTNKAAIAEFLSVSRKSVERWMKMSQIHIDNKHIIIQDVPLIKGKQNGFANMKHDAHT